MPAILTPTGCLTSSWNAVADDGKFQFRSGAKSTVLELARASGGEYTDDFATDPFSPPARLTNMLAGLWHWYAAGEYIYITGVPYTDYRCYFNLLGDFTNIIMKTKVGRNYHIKQPGLYGRINESTGTGYGIQFGGDSTGIYLYKSTGATNANKTLLDSEAFTNPINTWYWLKLSLQGTTIKGKVWKDGDAEPTTGGPDNDGYQLKATDSDYSSGKLGFYVYNYRTSDSCFVGDFWCNLGAFPSTSPVRYAVWDSAIAGSTWASGTTKIKTNVAPADSGTVKVKEAYSNTLYGVGDEAAVDALASDTWLEPDGSDEVTLAGGTGRYRYLLFQFNSDGAQQTSLAIYDEGQELMIGADSTPPGTASATVNAKIDGTTARFTLFAVPTDADLNEIKIEYAEKGALGAGTWARSDAFASNAVGQTVDVTVVKGARYAAHVISIDNAGNETINQALEFEPRNPVAGDWTEVNESVDPGWSEV